MEYYQHKIDTAKKPKQRKKWEACKHAIETLRAAKIKHTLLSEDCGQYRVHGFDFYATTGKFYNPHTNHGGRGVDDLIKAIKAKPKRNKRRGWHLAQIQNRCRCGKIATCTILRRYYDGNILADVPPPKNAPGVEIAEIVGATCPHCKLNIDPQENKRVKQLRKHKKLPVA